MIGWDYTGKDDEKYMQNFHLSRLDRFTGYFMTDWPSVAIEMAGEFV